MGGIPQSYPGRSAVEEEEYQTQYSSQQHGDVAFIVCTNHGNLIASFFCHCPVTCMYRRTSSLVPIGNKIWWYTIGFGYILNSVLKSHFLKGKIRKEFPGSLSSMNLRQSKNDSAHFLDSSSPPPYSLRRLGLLCACNNAFSCGNQYVAIHDTSY